MGFVAEPGIVLDVLSYSMFHFNYNSINYREKLYSNQEENPFLYYDQFRSGSRKIDPPPQLYPFFFYNPRGSSLTLMFSYIWNHNDFQGRTAEAYYGGLKGEVFKRYCLNYYLSGFSADVNMAGVMAGGKLQARAGPVERPRRKPHILRRFFYEFRQAVRRAERIPVRLPQEDCRLS